MFTIYWLKNASPKHKKTQIQNEKNYFLKTVLLKLISGNVGGTYVSSTETGIDEQSSNLAWDSLLSLQTDILGKGMN